MAYWLLIGPRTMQRPEIKAFCEWLGEQADITRKTIGEVPDPDTVDHLD
jgi:LysR family transcriptional regulator, glycine cleavage system transcriptional activator